MGATCLVAGILFALLGVLGAVKEGRAMAARWGRILTVTEARGPGAFRAASLTDARPLGVPGVVWAAGVAGSGFALFGPLAGAPTLVLLGFEAMSDPYVGRLGLGLAAAFGAVAILGHAGFTHSAARALLRCERRAGERARLLGAFATVVSGAVLGSLVIGDAVAVDRGLAACLIAAASAAVGLLLWVAGVRVDAVQDAMSDEEWDALPVDG